MANRNWYAEGYSDGYEGRETNPPEDLDDLEEYKQGYMDGAEDANDDLEKFNR